MNIVQLNTVNLGGDIVIKKCEGGSESGGSTIEYLDISGDSPLRDALISLCYLIKTDGFRLELPNNGSSSVERGVMTASTLMQVMVDVTYENFLIIKDSIKAVAIDFNTEIIIDGTIISIKVVFTGAEEMLNAVPRLTKEEFYNLD